MDVEDEDELQLLPTVTGLTDVNGTLNINGSGVFDANGTFDATGGTITMDGTANLELGAVVTSLGTLDDAAGTVTYNSSSGQDVFADTYYNLTVDQNANKTAAGTINVNGDFTADNNAAYRPSTFTTTVTGATVFSNNAYLSFANGERVFLMQMVRFQMVLILLSMHLTEGL